MITDIDTILATTREGFKTLSVGEQYQNAALQAMREWLTNPLYQDYVQQIIHLVNQKDWDYLLDSFYQVIPFGTGGRRGEVGVGPNRINPATIQSSAQGHSQYLIKRFGEDAKSRGIVLAYDTRQFFGNQHLNNGLNNPVKDLNGKSLSLAAAQVYTANGIKCFLFNDYRTTPELSFAVRHLHAVAGAVFSASHNPPDHNGKKVYDEFGGQLVPPDDEALVEEVTKNVSEIKTLPLEDDQFKSKFRYLDSEVDEAYIKAVCDLSLSDQRNIKLVYTPLHGCGRSSVVPILKAAGFTVNTDPKTSNYSGKFENVTFNIPNPEVIQSFDTTLEYAKSIDADLILNSDPDADRLGIMANHHNEWIFFNGNEIGALLSEYGVQKYRSQGKNGGVIVKTQVTTNLITKIAKQNQVEIIGDLLVGYKYIGVEMNKLEQAGRINEFIFAAEESHGYISGNYIREKDAALPSLWLAEYAAELKLQNKTLVDALNDIYAKYGYYRNYLTEIRLPGAEGMSQIQKIQQALRSSPPTQFGQYQVKSTEDWMNRLPILSETDIAGKQGLVFQLTPPQGINSIKVTVRPSGTEPKIKMYYEIGSEPQSADVLSQTKQSVSELTADVEKEFMKYCYKLIGVDFPDRGFLLFWQLPLPVKLKYFEIEHQIVDLKQEQDAQTRREKLNQLLEFLGSDPIIKVDPAFKKEYTVGILKYLELEN